jgi:hypothetical protein
VLKKNKTNVLDYEMLVTLKIIEKNNKRIEKQRIMIDFHKAPIEPHH